MAFFRKKTEEEKQASQERKQDVKQERMEARQKQEEFLKDKANKIANKQCAILKYYGGHPLYSKEEAVYLSVNESEITVDRKGLTGSCEIFTVNLEDIKKVTIEKEEEVIRRYTATRLALFGPFALAMKKKKVNKKEYLVIECKDFILTFDSNPKLCETIYLKVNNYKKNDNKQLGQIENLEQIKKLKELLDICAITQEEFDIKKKELLGI
ncbi:MAG: SHOCT domain-containing protein [Bacilli bacterium]